MYIYTMGFTQKSAEEFFGKIKENHIQLLIDVRLNNQSQLAGFTKGRDLAYFLRELCNCAYAHELSFAPTKELLSDYKKKKIDWDEYVIIFEQLMKERDIISIFKEKYMQYDCILLLCSEATPEHCHRRLLAERIAAEIQVSIQHL